MIIDTYIIHTIWTRVNGTVRVWPILLEIASDLAFQEMFNSNWSVSIKPSFNSKDGWLMTSFFRHDSCWLSKQGDNIQRNGIAACAWVLPRGFNTLFICPRACTPLHRQNPTAIATLCTRAFAHEARCTKTEACHVCQQLTSRRQMLLQKHLMCALTVWKVLGWRSVGHRKSGARNSSEVLPKPVPICSMTFPSLYRPPELWTHHGCSLGYLLKENSRSPGAQLGDVGRCKPCSAQAMEMFSDSIKLSLRACDCWKLNTILNNTDNRPSN